MCNDVEASCVEGKTSYQLQTTQQDQHASGGTAAHVFLSVSLSDDAKNNCGDLEIAQTPGPRLRGFISVARRAGNTSPHEDNTQDP